MTLADLNAAPKDAFVAALGHLFEHSPWVAEEGWAKKPFASRESLHRTLCDVVAAASCERQLALIRAHPDLAGRLAQLGQLTAASTREQASAGLNQLTPAEWGQFQDLNQRYKAKFGFPFVICARLNDRSAILASLQRRMSHASLDEQRTALAEIEKIAWLRLQDAVTP